MARGITKKIESRETLTIRRVMLGLYDELVIDKNRCVGCGICVKVCYKEALKLSSAVIREGKLLRKSLIAIDVSKCTFCAICAYICPMNAIKMFRNGIPYNPIIDKEILPRILKEVTVDVKKCDPICKLACKVSCPTEAISVKTEEEDGKITRITSISIDSQRCIFCGRCEYSCPQKAILVVKPFRGFLQLDFSRCPKGCRICVDICPSRALDLDEDGNIKVEEQFCIYCGACKEVCPEKAINFEIRGILYDKITSRTWLSILEKLISPEYVREELYVSSIKNYMVNLQKIRL